MRNFDSNGLHLAGYEGKLFEKSIERFGCSSKVFLRRFYYSDLLSILDKNDSSLLTLDESEGLDSIERQFGKTDYGKDKWNPNVLFWIGYIYRYISYTRETESRFIMKLFPPEMLKNLYYTYHTQSEEWVISNLLELKKTSDLIFDKNYRFKKALK